MCALFSSAHDVKGKMGGLPFVLGRVSVLFCVHTFRLETERQSASQKVPQKFSLEMGKANGKSFVSSGLAAFMLAVDNEPGSEVLCVARAQQQAQEVFDTTCKFCVLNPQLCSLFDIKPLQETITHGTSCAMRPHESV